MIAIFIVALVVFGPKKLPELGKSLGRGLREFNKAKNELKATWDEQIREAENHIQSTPPTTAIEPARETLPAVNPVHDPVHEAHEHEAGAVNHDVTHEHSEPPHAAPGGESPKDPPVSPSPSG